MVLDSLPSGKNNQFQKIWSTSCYSGRYGQDADFHVLEARFDEKQKQDGASHDEKEFLRRFTDGLSIDSNVAHILANPLIIQSGLRFSYVRDGDIITARYLLPKSHYITNQLKPFISSASYRLVEHAGAHVKPEEYVRYIALGEFPLANVPSWHMIHDRLDHVIGALATPSSQFAREQAFAVKTLGLDPPSNAYKTRSLIITDFLDALTYATTLSTVNNRLPTEDTYRELVQEFTNKNVDSSQALLEICQSPANVLSDLNKAYFKAVNASNSLL